MIVNRRGVRAIGAVTHRYVKPWRDYVAVLAYRHVDIRKLRAMKLSTSPLPIGSVFLKIERSHTWRYAFRMAFSSSRKISAGHPFHTSLKWCGAICDHACACHAVINRPRKTTEERVHSTLLACGVCGLAPCRQLTLQESTVKIMGWLCADYAFGSFDAEELRIDFEVGKALFGNKNRVGNARHRAQFHDNIFSISI